MFSSPWDLFPNPEMGRYILGCWDDNNTNCTNGTIIILIVQMVVVLHTSTNGSNGGSSRVSSKLGAFGGDMF